MKRIALASGIFLLAVGLWACAGTPGPGEAGYPFNLSGIYNGEVSVDGMVFPSSLDIETGAGGEIRGTYEVTSPVNMSGGLTGSLVADTARFNFSYMNPLDGCGGTLDGTGRVAEGGASFAGRVRVNDSCGGYLSGTFSFKK